MDASNAFKFDRDQRLENQKNGQIQTITSEENLQKLHSLHSNVFLEMQWRLKLDAYTLSDNAKTFTHNKLIDMGSNAG